MFSLWSQKKNLKQETARLEAFLSAMPGAYCGWSAKGQIIYSESFPGLLGLDQINDEYDIYNMLGASDAAALEGHFTALRGTGTSFEFEARCKRNEKIFRFSGKRGRNADSSVSYDILYLEDISDLASEKNDLVLARDDAENRLEDFVLTLDYLPQPVWVTDENGHIKWVNRFYAELAGSTRQRILSDQTLPVFKAYKDKPFMVISDLARQAIIEQKTRLQDCVSTFDGKRQILKLVVTPAEDKKLAIFTTYDISREETLNEEIDRYLKGTRIALEQLRAAIIIFDADQRAIFHNSEFSSYWDLESSWLNKRPSLIEVMERLREHRRLPEQADFKLYRQSWQNMFSDLLEPKEEIMHLPDGKTVRTVFMPRPNGGLIIIFEDVTSALDLEAQFNTLMAVQKETLDSLAEGVAVFGGDGRLKLCNPSYLKTWQLNPEDTEGNPHITKLIERKKKLFETQDWDYIKPILTRQALDRTSQEEEVALKDGRVLQIYNAGLPDGGVMVSYDDITDTVNVENALREKNAALEEAEQIKMDFLANVSYQLRTPLNAIMGFSEILENEYFGPLTDKQKEYTSGIHEAGERLLSLINDILDLSTIEAGYLDLNYTDLDIHTMMTHIFDLVQDWARKQKIEVKLNCKKNIGKMEADETRLKQVMLNLLRNAINFTEEHGHIILSAEKGDNNRILFRIEDTGAGIAEDELATIFKPFIRGKNAQKDNSGAGLGLKLVKDIAELHGGEVEVQSTVGEGSIFTLSIPMSRPDIKSQEAA